VVVPEFKKKLLTEFIKHEWQKTMKGKLNTFETLCKYSNSLIVVKRQQEEASEEPIDKRDQFTQSECYSVLMFGKNTPISSCCNQLLCFQFIRAHQVARVFCLEPSCKFNPIEERRLNSNQMHTIFETPNSVS